MSYRDDREALHNRVAQLEQELDDARREGQEQGRDEAQARAADLEKKVRDMRADLERMEAELQAMQGKAPGRAPRTTVLFAAIGVGAVAAVLGTVTIWARRASAPPPAPVVVAPEAPTPSPPKVEPAAPAPAPVETSPPETIPREPPPPPRSTTARWSAKIARAEGIALAPGSACTIEATIATSSTSRGPHAATNALVPELAVTCGAQRLYRSTDRLNGMAQMSNDAREELGKNDETSTFTVMFRDIGTRTGERTQIDLDTKHGQGAVFRDTIPRFRVELTMPASSTPGAPLSGPEQRLRREGKIAEISGASPAKVGSSCVLRAMPTGAKDACVAEVACGATVLWPKSAEVACTYEGARPVSVSAASEDGGAALSLEGATLKLATKAVAATITLEGP